MTREEAISQLQAINEEGISIYSDSIDMAISALEFTDSIMKQLDCKMFHQGVEVDYNDFALRQKGKKMDETYAQGTQTGTVKVGNDLVRIVREVHIAKESIDEIADAIIEKLNLPSAQPEIIRCRDCRFNTYSKKCLNPDSFFLVPADDFYCGYAERRTDEQTD